MLELKNVYVSYNDKSILENINLTINDGDVVAIIGPSGAGKSTLIRTMNLLVEPTKGSVLFNGIMLTKDNINKMRENIGMVFQQFELFPHLSVLDNMVLAPVKLNKMKKADAIIKAKELLNKVNLANKIDAFPNSLSGGEKQRVAIIRSLMLDPKMMLFDEPTSALDPEMVKEVLNVIKQLAKNKMTICIVTHEMKFAYEVSNRVLFVDQKKIIADDKPEIIFNNPNEERVKEFFSKLL